MRPATGYSHGVAASGRIIAVAGQVAMDEHGELVGPSDPRAQAERVFENLRAVLEASGASFANVIKFGVFIVDIGHLPVIREVRDRYLAGSPPPASTAVQRRPHAAPKPTASRNRIQNENRSRLSERDQRNLARLRGRPAGATGWLGGRTGDGSSSRRAASSPAA